MGKKYYRLREYRYLYSNEYTNIKDEANILLDKKEFDEIENFVLENRIDTGNGVTEFLSPGYKKGIGKLLKTKNYVGLIQTKNNSVIEILPKIYNKNSEIDYEKTIKIFLNMLKSFKEMPFKNYTMSNLGAKNIHLLDIFINMFLHELGILIKKGIKSGYVSVEENAAFYKGKLLMKDQITKNMIHKERFYIEYDNYIRNRAENKIIKATLLYLRNATENYRIQSSIRKYLFAMEDVEESKDIDGDFSKCASNRLLSDYDMILKWCKIFLRKQSFTNYKGSNDAYSLLFPMEKVFEKHVAVCIKQSEYFKGYKIKTQDSGYYLIESPKRFSLRPDIVMEKDGKVFILDTKWKLLNNDESSNYGISQSDLYQMFAYAKKYNSYNIVLIYPINDMVSNLDKEITFNYDENLRLDIVFVNLENIDASLMDLANRIKKYDCNVDDFESISGNEIIFEYRLGNAGSCCIGDDDGFSVTIYRNGDLIYKAYETENIEVKCKNFVLHHDTVKRIYCLIKDSNVNNIPESLNNGSCDGNSNEFIFYNIKDILVWNIIDEEHQPEKLDENYLREYGQNYYYECQVMKLFNEISSELLKTGHNLRLHSFA